MRRRPREARRTNDVSGRLAALIAAVALIASPYAALGATPVGPVPAAAAYPLRAPLARYMMVSEAAEVALARSAAPQAIAHDADVLVLGPTGYRPAAKGTNGFVCMVWRSWSDDLDDPQFWNPKVRAPICLNPNAVRTVLPDYLRRTAWVVAGLTLPQIRSRFADAAARGELGIPEPGAMSYMMSRQGHLADEIGHAAPHIMFFVPSAERQNWAANAPGSPIWGAQGALDPVALFFVVVPRWSDGTLASAH